MRLKSLYIEEYKNLKDFSLNFSNESFLEIFVGKNGSGKSNLFEALVEIFRSLFDIENGSASVPFNYKISYEIESLVYEIDKQGNQIIVNNQLFDRKSKITLPDNILIYYSGHNRQFDASNFAYRDQIKKLIKGGKPVDLHRLMHFDRDYKKALITFLLVQSFDPKISETVKERLGISSLADEFELIIERPLTVSSDYKIDRANDGNLYWGLKGESREFLRRIAICDESRERESGYIDKNHKKKYYKYFVSVSKFQTEFRNVKIDELIVNLNSVKILNMIGDIKFKVNLLSGEQQDIDFFSDGQFQSIYLFSLMEAFQDRNCISLLDEPDSFLHPEWQFKYLRQTKDVGEESKRKNHVLITTHSPSTIVGLDHTAIKSLEKVSEKIEVKLQDKDTIVKSLSSGLISYSEEEVRLNINHLINRTSGAVLFCEGISDELILTTAWKKLYPGIERKFEIQNAFGCKFLGNLFRRNEFFQQYPDRVFFALFDFDEAYSEWNNKSNELISDDPSHCLIRKNKQFNAYTMLLPVSQSSRLAYQVFNPNTGNDYGENSYFAIEHMFYGNPMLERYFIKLDDRPGNFFRFAGDKTAFATEVVSNLDPKFFIPFRPIFDFILSKI